MEPTITQDNNPFQVLYKGFDTIDIAFECRIRPEVLTVLQQKKSESQELNEHIATVLNGLDVTVADTGIKGFSYRFDTGLDGELWFLKKCPDMGWNLKVSVKSAALACHGYHGIKERLKERLWKICSEVGRESIGRVDFCVDFLAPHFELRPETFVCHSQATQRNDAEALEYSDQMKGRKYTGVTIGKMPGRQVSVYEKSREIKVTKKFYWWDIWNVKSNQKVWRVEVRSGKKHLHDVWKISTWKDLEEKAGDLLATTMQKIRMCIPSETDSNTTRWEVHPLWQRFVAVIETVFKARGFKPERVKTAVLEHTARMFEDLICGMAGAYAFLNGLARKNADQIGGIVRADVERFMAVCPEKVDRAYRRISNRYHFINPRKGGFQHG